jgi:transcription elongation factor GreA
MEETHLSPQAHQRLIEELELRTGARRREISEWIERAREHGDIRENADYDAAKTEQGHNEARVRQLEAILKSAVVVETAVADKVAAGTVVEVMMEGDDETSTYLIGSIEEKGRGFDVISPGSPLGKALLGHAPGDKVIYEAPGGRFEVEILIVRPAES